MENRGPTHAIPPPFSYPTYLLPHPPPPFQSPLPFLVPSARIDVRISSQVNLQDFLTGLMRPRVLQVEFWVLISI